jgi:hypothetical protein
MEKEINFQILFKVKCSMNETQQKMSANFNIYTCFPTLTWSTGKKVHHGVVDRWEHLKVNDWIPLCQRFDDHLSLFFYGYILFMAKEWQLLIYFSWHKHRLGCLTLLFKSLVTFNQDWPTLWLTRPGAALLVKNFGNWHHYFSTDRIKKIHDHSNNIRHTYCHRIIIYAFEL